MKQFHLTSLPSELKCGVLFLEPNMYMPLDWFSNQHTREDRLGLDYVPFNIYLLKIT